MGDTVMTTVVQELCLSEIGHMSDHTLALFRQAVTERATQLCDRRIREALACSPFRRYVAGMHHVQRGKRREDEFKYVEFHLDMVDVHGAPIELLMRVHYARVMQRSGVRVWRLMREKDRTWCRKIGACVYSWPSRTTEGIDMRHYTREWGIWWNCYANLQPDSQIYPASLWDFMRWLTCADVLDTAEAPATWRYTFPDCDITTPIMLMLRTLKRHKF